eukprot:TRINITY_DN17573_c0_g1_i1.p1 TRINITY_DN17573_c0_g1~~TRINITY_DN17573_c0_g1_i1.p1  ORF type:complete len:346 (+),score=10.37 TRINITY_DN17573_c0_g1_i1:110-1147(+)
MFTRRCARSILHSANKPSHVNFRALRFEANDADFEGLAEKIKGYNPALHHMGTLVYKPLGLDRAFYAVHALNYHIRQYNVNTHIAEGRSVKLFWFKGAIDRMLEETEPMAQMRALGWVVENHREAVKKAFFTQICETQIEVGQTRQFMTFQDLITYIEGTYVPTLYCLMAIHLGSTRKIKDIDYHATYHLARAFGIADLLLFTKQAAINRHTYISADVGAKLKLTEEHIYTMKPENMPKILKALRLLKKEALSQLQQAMEVVKHKPHECTARTFSTTKEVEAKETVSPELKPLFRAHAAVVHTVVHMMDLLEDDIAQPVALEPLRNKFFSQAFYYVYGHLGKLPL